MSAANCPFELEKKVGEEEAQKPKSRYANIKVKLDPKDPDSLVIEHEIEKIDSTDVEDVLNFNQRMTDTFIKLRIKQTEGEKKFTITENLMEGKVLQDFLQVKEAFRKKDPTKDVNDYHREVGLRWVETYMSSQIRLDTKDWMNHLKLPETWTVPQFIQRVHHINNLIPYMPEPDNWDGNVDSYSEQELMTIVRKAVPSSWKRSEVESGQEFTSLQDQARYYQGLKNLETTTNRRSRPNENENRYRRNDGDENGRCHTEENEHTSYRRNCDEYGRRQPSNNNQIYNGRTDYVTTNNGNQRQRIEYQGHNFYASGRHHEPNPNNNQNPNNNRSNNPHGNQYSRNQYDRNLGNNNRFVHGQGQPNRAFNNSNTYNRTYNQNRPTEENNQIYCGSGNRIVPYSDNNSYYDSGWHYPSYHEENFGIYHEEF